MDKLKKYIEDNKDSFDDIRLPEGHLERFADKLEKSNARKTKRVWLISLLSSAAAMLLLLFIGLGRQDKSSIEPIDIEASNEESCSDIQDEINELTLFYNMKMNSLLSDIETECGKRNNKDSASILKDSKSVRLEADLFEKNILPELPCSELSFEIITRQYDANIQSLSMMLEQVKRM
jgi:hypothetical protein